MLGFFPCQTNILSTFVWSQSKRMKRKAVRSSARGGDKKSKTELSEHVKDLALLRKPAPDQCLAVVSPILAKQCELVQPSKSPCLHEWEESVWLRTQRGRGCPCCSKRSGSKPYCTEQSLAAERFSHITKFWHPEKNGDMKPRDVRPYTKSTAWYQQSSPRPGCLQVLCAQK